MIKHDSEKFEFDYFDATGVKAGKLCYRYVKEGVIDAYSTRVEEAFQGKGIAAELYQALIAFAQEKSLKIKPSCSYVEVKMQKSHREMMA